MVNEWNEGFHSSVPFTIYDLPFTIYHSPFTRIPSSITMHKARDRRIEIMRRRLLLKSSPRIQVSLILSLTALAGFLTSFCLLHSGVHAMWARYPLAILIAYGVFLGLLRVWLGWQRSRRRLDVDLPVPDFIPSGSSDVEGFQLGGGGNFSGGGAGGNWGASVSSFSAEAPSAGPAPDASGLFDIDLEGFWLIVIAIVALAGGLIATFYIIYIAPVLLAEILVDGALVAGLYKRVKGIERRHWLRTAVRRTLLPALLVALFLATAGYALHRAVPDAHTMGDVWHHVMGS